MNREMMKLKTVTLLQVAVLVLLISAMAGCALLFITCARVVADSADAVADAANKVYAVTKTSTDVTDIGEVEDDLTENARYPLTAEERDLVERVVAAEARGEPLDGMRAVAQCILNTCEATGQRPDAVVMAPRQYADPVDFEVSGDVRDAVSAVFDDGETVFDETIRWFYSPAGGRSDWHEESLTYVGTVGGHRFFS